MDKKNVLGFIKDGTLHLIKSIPGDIGPEGPEGPQGPQGETGGISARYDASTETLIFDSID